MNTCFHCTPNLGCSRGPVIEIGMIAPLPRFLKIFEQYKKSPDVTRERMYLETMERVLGGADKIILDSGPGGGGVVPYLPLNEISRPPQTRAPNATGGRP